MVTVVAEGHDEVVEIVLEFAEDRARFDRGHPYPSPVGVGREVEVG